MGFSGLVAAVFEKWLGAGASDVSTADSDSD